MFFGDEEPEEDSSIKVIDFDYDKLKRTFRHEFIHYKQDTARTEKSGQYDVPPNWNEKGIYLTRPWENQAWAAEYIEYLRNRMKIKNPKQILNQLRKK